MDCRTGEGLRERQIMSNPLATASFEARSAGPGMARLNKRKRRKKI